MTLSPAWGYDGKSYSGKDMRTLVAALAGPGTGVPQLTGLAASASTPADANVHIAAGSAVIAAAPADGGSFHVFNDADTTVAIDPTSTNGRKDRIILNIASGVPSLVVVKGTPAASPSEPSLSAYSSYIELALITLPGSTSTVTSGMITDRRTPLFSGARASKLITGSLSVVGLNSNNTAPGLVVASVAVGPFPVPTTVELRGNRSVTLSAAGQVVGGWYDSGASLLGPKCTSTSGTPAVPAQLFADALVNLPANTTATYSLRVWVQAVANWQTFNDPGYSLVFARATPQ